MELAWEQTRNDQTENTRIADVGSYRFVITEEKTNPSAKPFYARLLHITPSKTYLLESGQYKTGQSAVTAMIRRASKYRIN